MTAAACLLALAAWVLAHDQPGTHRLVVLLPPRVRSPAQLPAGLSPRVVTGACLLAAGAMWAFAGGLLGLALAVGVALLGPAALGRLNAEADDEGAVARELPLALDLLAACLAGGAVPLDAVRAVASALPGPCGDRLATVAARLAIGSTAADAWRSLGEDRGPSGAAARAMSRAAVGGAPVASSVQRVADDARRDAAGQAERAARRAGVLAVGPLGLCFLPAFLLIGVVPAVVGLAAPLLTSF